MCFNVIKFLFFSMESGELCIIVAFFKLKGPLWLKIIFFNWFFVTIRVKKKLFNDMLKPDELSQRITLQLCLTWGDLQDQNQNFFSHSHKKTSKKTHTGILKHQNSLLD